MASEQSQPTPAHDSPPSSSEKEEDSLSNRFARACETTPLPHYQRPSLPGATDQQLDYLVQNDSNEIFMSPDAIWNNNDQTRPIILSALTKALENVCKTHGLEPFPPGSTLEQLVGVGKDKLEPIEDPEKDKDPPEDGEPENDQVRAPSQKLGQMPTACSIMGIPEFKPVPELRTLTWANSEAKKVIDAFNDETETIRAERAAKEEEEEAALLAKVPQPAKKQSPPPKPPIANDLVLWTAQEEAAASSVMRDLRARNKKTGLWGSKSTKLKPEAAAEMARARVAAAAAAAVMRNEDRSAELVRAEPVGSANFLERYAKGRQSEGGFYPMHAQVFQRAIDTGPGGKKKKKVAFAADTVFSRKK